MPPSVPCSNLDEYQIDRKVLKDGKGARAYPSQYEPVGPS